MEENSSSSRESYLDKNDVVLIALISSQSKSVKEEKISRQSDEAQNNSDSRQDYVGLPALSPRETPWAQGTTEREENSSSSIQS